MRQVLAAKRVDDFPSSRSGLAWTGLELPSFPQHSVSVRYATEHRCGLVVRGPGLSDAISGTDPLKDNLPLQARRHV